jgi:hypothetical protein
MKQVVLLYNHLCHYMHDLNPDEDCGDDNGYFALVPRL